LTYRYAVWSLALAAVFLIAYRFHSHVPVQVQDHNILAMTRQIYQATTQIGDVNASILTSLGTVHQQVGKVDAVQSRLETMAGLVDRQVGALERLTVQTRHQSELGAELHRLTQGMTVPVDGLVRTATYQAELVNVMSGRSNDLAVSLQAISTINRAIADKLTRAEKLAALVLSRMP
jgi:hypothetical protein